jgi:hypothetical protein
MARTATLLQLRTSAYRRADQENLTLRFPTTEVTDYINEGIGELWDMLVSANGYAYYGTKSTISLVNNTTQYSLPADFYKLHKVIYVGSTAGGRLELDRLSEADEVALQVARSRVPLYYRVRAAYLDVYPAPFGSGTLELSYVPCATKLANDGDTFDGINGFEEYVVCYAARRMAVKDADFELANMIYQDMNRQIERIERMAADRDKGHPERVQDVRGAIQWRRPKRLWLTRQ